MTRNKHLWLLFAQPLTIALLSTTLFGQQTIPAAAPPAATSSPATDPGLSKAECRLYDRYSPDKYTRVDCSLGNTIVVTFSHLTEWTTKENDPQKLLLILNGRVMKGLTPIGPATQHPDELRFDLKRIDLVQGDPDSQANRNAWTALLSRAQRQQILNVGVALAGNPPYYGTVPLLPAFDVFPQYWPVIVLFFLALLWAFLLLAHNSDIVRDAPSGDGGTKQPWYSLRTAPEATRKFSFSLARCQMAWWFFIILAAYNYIWMVTGDRDSLTPGALILMAISAATGFASFLVDSSKSDQRQALQGEQTALNSRLTTLATTLAAAPPPANVDDLKAEQQQKMVRLAQVTIGLSSLPTAPGPSQGFLNDILRDETGVSFHRFQMAVWTVVLGFVFVVAVYTTLAMPDFSATLLGLTGISAGTYVGFKIPDPPK
jgi:hypothetical protein